MELADIRSASQWARKFTESWWAERGYCFACESNRKLRQMPANTPARDFICEDCDHPYELKATKLARLSSITDGDYAAMMGRIETLETPTFLTMHYSTDQRVLEVAAVHRVFITSQVIFKRNPLPITARRAGWVGCNIILRNVPPEAKIGVIHGGAFLDRSSVREQFAAISALSSRKTENRGWMAAVLAVVHKLPGPTFQLHDLDRFVPDLQKLFPDNHHIEAKMRQQLQFLRDAGLLRFLDNKGTYQRIERPDQQSLLR